MQTRRGRGQILGGLVLVCLPVLAGAFSPNQKAVEIALDQIREDSETSPDDPLNTVPEGCLSDPLPLTPVGPTFGTIIEGFQTSARMLIWRAPCRPDNAALMVTFEPIEGDMFICSSRVDIRQQEAIFDTARLVDEVSSGQRFCGDLTAAVTTVVDQPPFTDTFDDNGGFTFIYRGTESHYVWVDPYQPELFFDPEDFEKQILRAAFSGAWFEPEAPGQGFQFLLAENEGNTVLVAYWYTYRNGSQEFLFGVAPVTAAQREIEIELRRSSGADFGANFHPDDVLVEPWGRLWLSFDNCREGQVRYESNDGSETGSIEIDRLTSLSGLTCREPAAVPRKH